MFEKISGIEQEILEELEICQRTNYDNLASKFFVSKNTIRRAVSRLEQVYPILKFQGKDGGIELDKQRYGLPNDIRNLIITYLEKMLELPNNSEDEKNLYRCISYLSNKSIKERYSDENKVL